MRTWIFAIVSLGSLTSVAFADNDVVVESHAGFGTNAGNTLMPAGTLIASPTISVVWRHRQLAADLTSALIAGGPGEQPSYWSLGLGVRYYLPLASTVRNKIETELSLYGRVGASRVAQTRSGLGQTGSGRSLDLGTGVELSLSPLASFVVTKLQLATSRRVVDITGGASHKPVGGVISTASLGFSVGARF